MPLLNTRFREELMSAPIVVVDVEATGFSPERDRIIQLAWIAFELRLVEGRVKAVGVIKDSSIVDPGCVIPWKIQELTGITGEEILTEKAPEFGVCDAARQLWIVAKDSIVVGHNVAFDWRFLCEEWARAGLMYPRIRNTFDTLAVARMMWPQQKNNLEAVCERMGVELKGAHRATHDVAATARVFRKMMQHDYEEMR